MNIIICGSLKDVENIEKLRDKIYDGLGDKYNGYNVIVCTSRPELTMFAAQLQYVKDIANADMVLIVPKEVKWDNKLYFNQKTLSVLETYIPIGVHEFEYHDHEGITIGEGTSYEMAIARHFDKPIYIVTDTECLKGESK